MYARICIWKWKLSQWKLQRGMQADNMTLHLPWQVWRLHGLQERSKKQVQYIEDVWLAENQLVKHSNGACGISYVYMDFALSW